MGLVSEIAEQADLLAKGWAMAKEMNRNSPLGLRMTKDLLNLNEDAPSLEAAIAVENRTQVLCGQTEDLREGVAAFLEKREPEFKDR
jgi:enoyl-CoA hydratase/carnithine racemase